MRVSVPPIFQSYNIPYFYSRDRPATIPKIPNPRQNFFQEQSLLANRCSSQQVLRGRKSQKGSMLRIAQSHLSISASSFERPADSLRRDLIASLPPPLIEPLCQRVAALMPLPSVPLLEDELGNLRWQRLDSLARFTRRPALSVRRHAQHPLRRLLTNRMSEDLRQLDRRV